MVWVWPPHTSMSLYCLPGWQRPAILAASAWAFSASRNSSTKRTAFPLLDLGLRQGDQLVGVGLADPLQELECGLGLVLVDLGEREADVDQHPVARRQCLTLEQADVDRPLYPTDVHLGQVGPVRQQLHHLTRDPKAHPITPPRPRTPPGTSYAWRLAHLQAP